MTELIKRINKIKKAGYYRKRTPIESAQDVYIKLNNKKVETTITVQDVDVEAFLKWVAALPKKDKNYSA